MGHKWIRYSVNGTEKTVSEWAKVCGISRQRFFQLLRGFHHQYKSTGTYKNRFGAMQVEEILARYPGGREYLK